MFLDIVEGVSAVEESISAVAESGISGLDTVWVLIAAMLVFFMQPGFALVGIFFTMYDSRTRLAQDVVMQVKSYFKDVVFNTIIPRNVRLSEAPSHGLPICKYDPECVGARSYEKLAEEVIRRG